MATFFNFEMFPDEIILNICGYLRGTDVLYSFFDLNTRLNITIAGYCQYVNLLAPAYIPFHHVISYVLPRIGPFVRSFVLNGNWKSVMSANTLAVLFGSQLSVMFPHLQTLTLKWFTGENMSLFLPSLENFSHLFALDIRVLNGKIEDDLLTRILAANNGRLKFVSFDEDCVSLNIPEGDEIVSYPNIEELTVNINLNQSFPRLFTFVPNVRRLHVTADKERSLPKFSIALATLSPLVHLIDFQLRSRLTLWAFEETVDLLHLMPSLQKLTLGLLTSDERLVIGENLIKTLPSSVTQIDIAIHYYFSGWDFNIDELHALWPDSLPVICLLDIARVRVLFHTIPYNLRSIVLPAELSEQMSSGWHWKHMQQVEDLCVYNITSLAQILLMVQHFHRLQRLTISIASKSEPCAATLPKQAVLIKLPRLKQLAVLGICPLTYFVKAAPNLDYLDVTFNCLKNLLDDEQICTLLQQRITRLDIGDWLSTEVDRLQHIARVFSNLRQLIIELTDSSTTMDSTVLAVLANWYDKQLHWLFVKGSLSDQAKENLRQWLLEHTNHLTNDSFAVNYNDRSFTLWK